MHRSTAKRRADGTFTSRGMVDNTHAVKHHQRRAFGSGKRTPTYQSWRSALMYCFQPSHCRFYLYGGRGITVVKRWLGKHGFENFLRDMGHRPANSVLSRLDRDDNFTPSNCFWRRRESAKGN
jgi:hypothetical protein